MLETGTVLESGSETAACDINKSSNVSGQIPATCSCQGPQGCCRLKGIARPEHSNNSCAAWPRSSAACQSCTAEHRDTLTMAKCLASHLPEPSLPFLLVLSSCCCCCCCGCCCCCCSCCPCGAAGGGRLYFASSVENSSGVSGLSWMNACLMSFSAQRPASGTLARMISLQYCNGSTGFNPVRQQSSGR